jgi:hypothetical protein
MKISWLFMVFQSVAAARIIADFSRQAPTFAIKKMSLRHNSGGPSTRSQFNFNWNTNPKNKQASTKNR